MNFLKALFEPKKAGLKGRENTDELPDIQTGWNEPQLEDLLSWRLSYSRLNNLTVDEVLTERQLKHFLVEMAKPGNTEASPSIVEKALKELSVDETRAEILADDLAEALRDEDGVPDFLARGNKHAIDWPEEEH